MEFFDIDYCRALIEYNKCDDIYCKIEKIKNINNEYVRYLLRIDIKLKYDIVDNRLKLKQYNISIINDIINTYFIKKEMKSKNIVKDLKLNTDGIYKIMNEITKSNNYKISIPEIKKLFNIKNTKRDNRFLSLFLNDLEKNLILFYNSQQNEFLSKIENSLYKISKININKNLISNLKNKLLIFKKINFLKKKIENNIKLYKKTQNNFEKKIKKSHKTIISFTKIINNNLSIIDNYKNIINANNKKKIINKMNKNYNKCKIFDKDDDITCSICLEQVEEGISTNCNHVFHLECINLYVNNLINNPIINILCPMCRAYI